MAFILTAMTEKQKDTETSSDPAAPRRRLLRSPTDRLLAGVAGGLGDYLGLDPTLVRLGFVVAAFFGGFGVLAYLVMAVVVPEDDGTGRPVANRRPPIWALALLGIALLFALPGPFWGWGAHGWWWGFAGPLWIAILILAGIWAYRALSGRPLRLSRGKAEAGPEPPADRVEGGPEAAGDNRAPRAVRAIAIIVLALAGVAAAATLAAVSGWATATGNGAGVGAVVIALGAALAATAFLADARRLSPWLLGLALVLALPAGAVAAADIRFDGGIGEREYTPTDLSDIPDDGYELGVGQLTVDLRELAWSDGQVVSLTSELGVGRMIVSVPSSVCVVGEAGAKAGELLVRGDSNAGVDPEFDRGEPSGVAPRLELDAELQLGQLVVTDDDPDEVERHDRGGDDAEEAAAAQAACDR